MLYFVYTVAKLQIEIPLADLSKIIWTEHLKLVIVINNRQVYYCTFGKTFENHFKPPSITLKACTNILMKSLTYCML